MTTEQDVMKFTEDDLLNCWPAWSMVYFVEILNGDYKLEAAREDLRSLIGSKYDNRTETPN